jgi:trigger factor
VNVAVERLPESQVVLDITTDEQEFEKALQRAYRKVVNQVRLPGFRPGKAPRFVIERMLGREVLIEQADRDLLDPLYQQALDQEQINPVGEPEVEIYQTEPLAFKVTVQVYPTIDLGGYQEVRVEPRPVAVTDEQVEEAIERLRSNRSPWNELAEARPAREGDRVTVDVELWEKGADEPYREPITDSTYILGKDNLFAQLRDALIGANAGDIQSVEIEFAEDDETAEAGMRGKTMVYTLTLKKIEEQELVALDDEFASTASEGRATTVEALRNDVRKDLMRAERQKARNEVATEVVNAMSALATIDVPPVMVDKQVDSDVEDLRNRLSQEQQTLESYLRLKGQSEEELREELRPEAARRLRNSLVLREIATREGVSVSAQDIDAEIDRLIGTSENREQLRQIYSGNYIRNLLENELFERKLMDHVIGIATEGRGPADPPEEPEEESVVEASAESAVETPGEDEAADEGVAEQVAELEDEAAVDAELAPGAVASEDEAGREAEGEKPSGQE